MSEFGIMIFLLNSYLKGQFPHTKKENMIIWRDSSPKDENTELSILQNTEKQNLFKFKTT